MERKVIRPKKAETKKAETKKAETKNAETKNAAGGQQVEDRAFKMAAQFFGEELLPQMGVEGKIRRIAPTEQVHLEMKDFLEDFNFEMEDGTWRHFEFESDAVEEEDLVRFRAYEAITGYYYEVEVITYVVCTADAEVKMREIRQGINTYRVEIVCLKGDDADEVFRELEKKREEGRLNRDDLVRLLLTPLMSGETGGRERIARGIRLLQDSREELSREDLLRMESVLYAFAMKLLTSAELNELEEVFHMTILGQRLEDRGVEKGVEAFVLDRLEDNETEQRILDRLERRFSLSREDAKRHYDKYAR